MSNIDKQALREAATVATQGGWYVDYDFDVCHESGAFLAETHGDNLVQNAKFIAAANPSTVLALLDELEKAQRQIVNFQQSCENDPRIHEIIDLKERIAELDQRLIEYAGIATREARRVAELEARAVYPAILDVMAERQRQQSVEGWTPEHDDEHCNGELAMAAVCYINDTGAVNRNGGKPWGWPWDASWWKPDTRRRNLVKAGALILAEIERIDRAAGIKVIEGEGV
ncbi:ead/Ea22-like family protein [Salmonella enterica subsp. enterica serovar Gloucester]|nr:ead/Ea22-like family protein [Salmonella enterica subsp. enterica serovar Gloucester]